MEILSAAVLGFLTDLALGDPAWMPHLVVYMGKAIAFLERFLRSRFPKNEKGEGFAGLLLVLVMTFGTLGLSGSVLVVCGRVHPLLRFAAEVIWSWQVLALKDLKKESMAVAEKLTCGTLAEAREAVSRIVGRDTERLNAEGVAKAAVETVAENFSDGEMAPLFWLMLGGAPLALCYKAVNTMDSMVGYKNERYLHFGRCAARLDDAANYVPARLSALLLIAAAWFCGEDPKRAFKIWRRDRRKHASPNSAQTESVVAGALGIRLAGPAWYFGEYHEKQTLGDPLRTVVPDDIRRANRMDLVAGILGLILLGGLRLAAVSLTRCI